MPNRGSIQPGGTMFKMARYPSGKGEVCKTFMRRFDSDPRLHLFQSLTFHAKASTTSGCREKCRESLHPSRMLFTVLSAGPSFSCAHLGQSGLVNCFRVVIEIVEAA
jgi:hypothetical protein